MPPLSTQHVVADALNAPAVHETLPQAAITALWQGHVVEAIRLVRLERNIGLQETKDQVDVYLLRQKKMEQAQVETREGVLRWLTSLLIGGIGLACLLMQRVALPAPLIRDHSCSSHPSLRGEARPMRDSRETRESAGQARLAKD